MLLSVNWEEWTAIGTLSAAGATFFLGLVTVVLGSITRSQLRAAMRPLLVDIPPDDAQRKRFVDFKSNEHHRAPSGVEFGRGDVGFIEVDWPYASFFMGVPIRNIGNGSAVVSRRPEVCSAKRDEVEAAAASAPFTNTSKLLIPSGEDADIIIVWPGYPLDGFYLDVWYTDAQGRQETRTRLLVNTWSSASWRVDRVELFKAAGASLARASWRELPPHLDARS